jgi:hypothetical protein
VSGAVRYGPSAPLVHVSRLDEGACLAVVAKPCDIAAIRTSLAGTRVARQVPYLLTLSCGGVPFTAARGSRPSTARTRGRCLRWRGGAGWSDASRVPRRPAFDLTYDETWFDPRSPGAATCAARSAGRDRRLAVTRPTDGSWARTAPPSEAPGSMRSRQPPWSELIAAATGRHLEAAS